MVSEHQPIVCMAGNAQKPETKKPKLIKHTTEPTSKIPATLAFSTLQVQGRCNLPAGQRKKRTSTFFGDSRMNFAVSTQPWQLMEAHYQILFETNTIHLLHADGHNSYSASPSCSSLACSIPATRESRVTQQIVRLLAASPAPQRGRAVTRFSSKQRRAYDTAQYVDNNDFNSKKLPKELQS